MKPSSVYTKELFERLPVNWIEKRLKFVSRILPSNVDKKSYEGQKAVRLCNYVDVYYNDSIDHSSNYMLSTASDQEIKKFSLKKGDVILTKDSESRDDIGIPAVVREEVKGLVCGYHLTVLKPQKDVFGNFLFWYIYSKLSSSFFEKRANGITRFAIGMNTVGSLPIIFPPLETQKKIANFLDKETTRIDTLIAKKQRQIELLQEKRQAIITQAVTKGLDPTIKMKDSGVEWIGEIPEHWEIRRFKYIFRIKKRISRELGFDVLSITQKGIKIKDIESGEGQLASDYSKYQHLFAGEYAMNHMDLLTGFVDISSYDGVTSPDYRVFSLINQKENNAKYFLYYLQMGYLEKWFFPFGQGSAQLGRWRLPSEAFCNFLAPIPPRKEQAEIASIIDQQITSNISLIEKLGKSIDLLKEYRSSLITHAVSGQLDISKYEVSHE